MHNPGIRGGPFAFPIAAGYRDRFCQYPCRTVQTSTSTPSRCSNISTIDRRSVARRHPRGHRAFIVVRVVRPVRLHCRCRTGIAVPKFLARHRAALGSRVVVFGSGGGLPGDCREHRNGEHSDQFQSHFHFHSFAVSEQAMKMNGLNYGIISARAKWVTNAICETHYARHIFSREMTFHADSTNCSAWQ